MHNLVSPGRLSVSNVALVSVMSQLSVSPFTYIAKGSEY